MKKSKLILTTAVLTLVLVFNRFVDNSSATNYEVNVFKQIENQMPYPDFGKGENLGGKVIVEFKCDERGKVKILNINYSNTKLKNYVSERLSEMNIQIPTNNTEHIYRVEFSFNLL